MKPLTLQMTALLAVVLAADVSAAQPAKVLQAASPTEQVKTPNRPTGTFSDRVFRDETGEHRYSVFLPPGYTSDKKWPVILFLHGAGERGTDGKLQLAVGLGPLVKFKPEQFPAVIVFPQVESFDERIQSAWSPESPDGRRALAILSEVEKQESIDPARRSLVGWSMGGFGVWQIATNSPPGFWKSALSISGGAVETDPARLPEGLAFWAIHGSHDRIVTPASMQVAAEAVRKAGKSLSDTVIEGVGHEVWKPVLSRPEVITWVLDPQSVDPKSLDWSSETLAKLEADVALPERPFTPAMVISRAIAVRLGNKAFAELAKGIPDAIPADRLAGDVDDIEQSIEFGGSTIQAAIRDIRWTADLTRVQIQAEDAEKLIVRVGLSNLTLHAGRGQLSGGGYEAACGPFQVIIGRRHPVWVVVTTRPRAVKGEVHLTRNSIDFTIPGGNWYVTEPEWATAKGEGLTPELVKVGVVGGMYRARARVEEAVRELIPPLIDRIEHRLKIVPSESMASLLWPLPTSPPRFRLIAEGIRTDRDGVSATLGLEVEGAVESAGSLRSIVIEAPIQERTRTGADLGVSPDMITAISRTMTNDPGSRLDVRDAPGSALSELGQRELLLKVAPGLEIPGVPTELRTVISLPEPFGIDFHQALEGSTEQQVALLLKAPVILLTVSRRPADGDHKWQPCLECRVSLEQPIRVQLKDRQDSGRQVELNLGSEARINGDLQKLPGFEPIDGTTNGELLVDAFRKAWLEWSSKEPTLTTIQDFAVGSGHLQLDAVPRRGDRLWLEFAPHQQKTPARP